MRRRLSLVAIALLLAACSSAPPSATPNEPTVAPTSRFAPTPTPAPPTPTAAAPAGTGLFGGLPYSLDLPAGWVSFDLSNPAAAAAIDAFVAENPGMAGLIEAFKALPNVVLAVNQLTGNAIVTVGVPTGGLPLDAIGASFTAQFANLPGVKEPPEQEELTLPAGPALHWDLALETNTPGGGTAEVAESVYLVENGEMAVLVEFVDSTGAGVPQEEQIIKSLRLQP